MLVLAPGAHSRVANSARPEHWKGFQTSRPHHMDRKKLFIDYSGSKYARFTPKIAAVLKSLF